MNYPVLVAQSGQLSQLNPTRQKPLPQAPPQHVIHQQQAVYGYTSKDPSMMLTSLSLFSSSLMLHGVTIST